MKTFQSKVVDLPLGTRIRYVGKTKVYVLLENWGHGLLAEWVGPHGPTTGQGMFSVVERNQEIRDVVVEVVEFEFGDCPPEFCPLVKHALQSKVKELEDNDRSGSN